MKEMKLEIPADYEVDKVETQDGHIVVTFKKIERMLPKSWEEFCDMFHVKKGECYIHSGNFIEIFTVFAHRERKISDQNILPDRATAEAVLALCQLIQLRNCYNGDWVPDWEDNKRKYFIEFGSRSIQTNSFYDRQASPLYFKTEELRDEFLRNFRQLIEKLKPLYGIMEGGEE